MPSAGEVQIKAVVDSSSVKSSGKVIEKDITKTLEAIQKSVESLDRTIQNLSKSLEPITQLFKKIGEEGSKSFTDLAQANAALTNAQARLLNAQTRSAAATDKKAASDAKAARAEQEKIEQLEREKEVEEFLQELRRNSPRESYRRTRLKDYQSSVSDVKTAYKDIAVQYESLRSSSADAFSSDSVLELISNIDKLIHSFELLKSSEEELVGAGFLSEQERMPAGHTPQDYIENLSDIKAFVQDTILPPIKSQEVLGQYDVVENGLKNLEQEYQAVITSTDNLSKSTNVSDEELSNLQQQIEETIGKVTAYRDSLTQISDYQRSLSGSEFQFDLPETFTSTKDKVDSMISSLQRASQTTRNMGADAKKAQYEYSKLQAPIQETVQQLNAAVQQGRELKNSGETSGKNWEENQQKIQSLTAALQQYIAMLKEAGLLGEAGGLGAGSELGQQIAELSKLATGALGGAQRFEALDSLSQKFEQAKSSLANLGATIKQAFAPLTKLMSLFGKLAGKIGHSVSQLLKHNSALHKNRKSSKSFNQLLAQGVKNFLRYALGIRSVYVLFNKIRNAIKAGYKNLAGYSDEVNQSISSVLSNAEKLKNQLAAMVEPLVTAFVPILNAVIEKTTEAALTLGKFFGALTGRQTVYKANDQQKQFVENMEETADATKDAAQAMDEYLSPLDDLNRFTDDKNKGTSVLDKSKDKDKIDYSSMFETVPIDAKIKELAQRIKAGIKNGDLRSVGEELAAKLNSVVSNISSTKIGQTIANVINAASSFALGFLDTIGVEQIAEKISTNINTALSNINAYQVGNAIVEFFNKAFQLALSLLQSINWSLLGQRLGEFFSGIVENADVDTIADTIAGVINAAVDFGLALFEAFDFEDFGSKLADTLGRIFNSIDWTKAGKLLGKLVTSLVGLFAQLIRRINPQKITLAISQLLGNINWRQLGNKVAQLVKVIFDVAKAALAPGTKAIVNLFVADMNRLIDAINFVSTSIQEFLWGMPADWIADMFGVPSFYEPKTIPHVPYLAQGAVIPPNRQFLAMLGDQKSGNNIEAPEALIRKIVREESGNNSRIEVPVYIGNKEITRVVIEGGKVLMRQTGANPFALEH